MKMVKVANKKNKMYAYLISHDRKDIKTHTYIGVSGDFIYRLKQHNAEVSGGPRITRRAAGNWKPVIILCLPQGRAFSSKDLKKEWKTSSRGLESRIRKGFELAKKYKVNIFINKEKKSKIKILKDLNGRWNDENKILLSELEWKNVINGDEL